MNKEKPDQQENTTQNPYEGKSLKSLCPLTAREKGRKKKKKEIPKIADCQCEGCGLFREKNTITTETAKESPSLWQRIPFRNTIIGIIGIGAVVGGLTSAVSGSPEEQKSVVKSPQKIDPEKTVFEVNQEVLRQLEVKEKQMQPIIDMIEGELLEDLKTIKSPNPKLQEVINGIINIIEHNKTWEERNGYSFAKKMWKKKDHHQPFVYNIGEQEEKVLSSASEWTFLVETSNPWVIKPPLISYFLTKEDEIDAGQYIHSSGKLCLNPNTNFKSLISKALIIHEIIHVWQAQNIEKTATAQEYQNFKNNLYQADNNAPDAVHLPIQYYEDLEADAYAGCLEIANSINGGKLASFIKECVNKEKKTLTNMTDENNTIFLNLSEGCDPKLRDSFLDTAAEYFQSGNPHYPESNILLKNHNSENGWPRVRLEDLLSLSRRELADYLKQKKQQTIQPSGPVAPPK